MSKTVRVAVPKEAGDEIRISYGGADAITYKVRDGYVTVDDQHVDAFLSNIEGATVDAGNTGSASTAKEAG